MPIYYAMTNENSIGSARNLNMQKMKVLIGVLVFAAIYSQTTGASARWGRYGAFGYGGYGYGYGYGLGYGNYGGGTLEGNYLQGMSQVITAQGEYNLNTAQAGVSYEEARSKYLDNQKKWRENYTQMKEERQRQAIEQHEINKATNEARAAAQAAKPPVYHGLGRNSLDPLTGQITWPEILRGAEFDAQRKQVDQLFELRAKTSSSAATADKIHATVQDMQTHLRKGIEKFPASQYIAAQKFLDALDYTGRNNEVM